jgi:hypothetical protein
MAAPEQVGPETWSQPGVMRFKLLRRYLLRRRSAGSGRRTTYSEPATLTSLTDFLRLAIRLHEAKAPRRGFVTTRVRLAWCPSPIALRLVVAMLLFRVSRLVGMRRGRSAQDCECARRRSYCHPAHESFSSRAQPAAKSGKGVGSQRVRPRTARQGSGCTVTLPPRAFGPMMVPPSPPTA